MKSMLLTLCLSVLVGCGVGVGTELEEATRQEVGSRSDAVLNLPDAGSGGGITNCGTGERCFGAAGPQCASAVTHHFGCSGGKCFISAGSIAHDTCCAANPNGQWCNGLATAFNSGCTTAWAMANDRQSMGLSWQREINVCTSNDTGVVNMALYCAPEGVIVRAADASVCCGGASRAFNINSVSDQARFESQGVDVRVLGQPLIVCTGVTPVPPPPPPPPPSNNVQDLPCNPKVGCGANAACTQRTLRGVFGYYCTEF